MKVRTSILGNGVTVVTETMAHLESVALGVWVKSGSRDETADEHGIAHLLEHMAFKGTRTRNARQIAEEIENVGGELNAATSTETTSYYARVLKDHVPLAIDILHDILTDSVFDESELTREKHVILQEIGAANDTPDDVVYDRFTEAAFRDQTIGRPILGTPETVKSFTPAQIRAYLARHYTGDRIVVVAAGAVDHDQFVKLVDDRFGKTIKPTGTQLREIPKADYTGGDYRENRDLMDAQVLIGFEGAPTRCAISIVRNCSPTFWAAACRRGCSRKFVKSAGFVIQSTPSIGAFRIRAYSAFMRQPAQRISRNSYR
jgi:predicted Zn-dependent peptidase